MKVGSVVFLLERKENGDLGVEVFEAVTFEGSVRLKRDSTSLVAMSEVRASEAGDWKGRRKRSAVSKNSRARRRCQLRTTEGWR